VSTQRLLVSPRCRIAGRISRSPSPLLKMPHKPINIASQSYSILKIMV